MYAHELVTVCNENSYLGITASNLTLHRCAHVKIESVISVRTEESMYHMDQVRRFVTRQVIVARFWEGSVANRWVARTLYKINLLPSIQLTSRFTGYCVQNKHNIFLDGFSRTQFSHKGWKIECWVQNFTWSERFQWANGTRRSLLDIVSGAVMFQVWKLTLMAYVRLWHMF